MQTMKNLPEVGDEFDIANLTSLDTETTSLENGEKLRINQFLTDHVVFDRLSKGGTVTMSIATLAVYIDRGNLKRNAKIDVSNIKDISIDPCHVGQKFIVKSELYMELYPEPMTFSVNNVFTITHLGDPIVFEVEKLGGPPIHMSVANFVELLGNGSLVELKERKGADVDGDNLPELKLSGKKVRLRTCAQRKSIAEIRRLAHQAHPDDLKAFIEECRTWH